jgi:hypothetical protein
VLVRGSEEPVPFATVFRDNAAVGQTSRDEILQAQVPIGVEFSWRALARVRGICEPVTGELVDR